MGVCGLYMLLECDRCGKREYVPTVVDDLLHTSANFSDICVNLRVDRRYVHVRYIERDWTKIGRYVLCKECSEEFAKFMNK